VIQCENRFNQTSPSSSNQTQNQLSQLILALNNSSRNNSNELSLYDLQMTILGSIDGMKMQILNLKNDTVVLLYSQVKRQIHTAHVI
jgi:hypothetical protein